MEKSGVMILELEVTAAKLTGDPARDIKSLSNHVFMLEEKLRYTLRNLDVTNFNDLGLARYENGRLQIYTKAVEIQTEKLRVEFGKETDEIHALISATADELLAEIEDVEGNYSSLTQTVSQIQTTISGAGGLQSQITQTNNKITAVVTSIGDAGGNVNAASIVAAINNAGSTVKINADHIVLSGVVTAEDLAGNGTTVINGANIQTGEISAVNFIAKGDISAVGSISNSIVIQNMFGRAVGKIGYANVYSDYERSDKLYLVTEEYYADFMTYKPSVKILGAGGVSIETGVAGPVYIASTGSYVAIEGAEIFIRDNVGAEWRFFGGALYKNGQQVL